MDGLARRGLDQIDCAEAAGDRQYVTVDPVQHSDDMQRERSLLYVACTRARDHLLVTSVDPASEFLDDLRM